MAAHQLCAISLITIPRCRDRTLTRLSASMRRSVWRLQRPGCCILLRHATRLVGRGADRIGYRIHILFAICRRSRRSNSPVVGPDGAANSSAADGQDDRRAIDRRRLHATTGTVTKVRSCVTCSCTRSCWHASSRAGDATGYVYPFTAMVLK